MFKYSQFSFKLHSHSTQFDFPVAFWLTKANINPLTLLSSLNILDNDDDDHDEPRKQSILMVKSRLKWLYRNTYMKLCLFDCLNMINFLEWKVEILAANRHCQSTLLLYVLPFPKSPSNSAKYKNRKARTQILLISKYTSELGKATL